jgi:DNA helicase-2/ATP-dependent DNA helicase PcrA
MLSSNVTTILGSPGTGKTTRLLDIMEQELAKGVSPDRLAFCSFTNKAVDEAKERAMDRFNYTKDDLKNFKTVHSFGYSSLGLSRSQVMAQKHYDELGKHLGLKFNSAYDMIEGPAHAGRESGSHYLFYDGYVRATGKNPKDVWDMYDHMNLNWFEFQRFSNTLAEYKKTRDLYDFTDMLAYMPRAIDIEVVIIDEAQDLSTLQWNFLEMLFKKAKRIYIGGDDDQAIFEWAGANVNKFINLPGKKEVLKQSYRVPEDVHRLATNLSSRITNRSDKVYMPRKFKGEVNYWRDVDSVDLSSGTWLLMSRNAYSISEMSVAVREQGFNYAVKGKPILSAKQIEAIRLYENWRKGYVLDELETEKVKVFAPVFDITKIWHEAFTKLAVETREYYISLLRRGENLLKPPRINITTIHGSKGGEADHTVIISDMAYTTWSMNRYNTDAEARVWYVGATRAKETLNIILPKGRYGYDI